MKKNYVMIIALVFISTFFLIMKNKKVLDDNEEMPNFGDIGGGILFSGNQVSFSDSSYRKKNVQEAIDELYASIGSYCHVGYTKGTETATTYVCNKNSESTFSTLAFESANVKYDNTTSGLDADDVSEALIELADLIPYCITDYEKQNEQTNSYDCVRTIMPSTLTITDGSVSLTYGTNGSNAYTFDGDGTLSCTSGDTTKVTCSVDTTNHVISLTPVGSTVTNQSISYVTITVSGTQGTQYDAPNDVTFYVSVDPRTVTITAPTVNSSTLTYSGSGQTLFNSAGSCTTGGTMYWYGAPTTTSTAPTFSTSTWTTTAPSLSKTDAGTYYLYYYCKVDDTTNNTGTNINTVLSLSKPIGKATASAPTLTASTVTYDSASHCVGVSGGTSGLTIQYAYRTWNGSAYGSWSGWGTTSSYYCSTNAGKWEIKAKVVGNNNYNDSTESNTVVLTINKAEPTLTVANGSGQCDGGDVPDITTNSNGSLSCSTSNSAVATCTAGTQNGGGKYYDVAAKKKGTVTITITLGEGTNWTSKTATATYTVTSCWVYKHKYDDTPTCTCTGGSCCQAKYCGGTVGVSINKNKARCGSSSSSVPTGSGTGKYCWCNLGA